MKLHKLARIGKEGIKTSLVKTTGSLWWRTKSPDEVLGELFAEVQRQKIFEDGKTFADLLPKRRLRQIQQDFELERQAPNFDLHEFVSRHFYEYSYNKKEYHTDTSQTAREHITHLWPILERRNRRTRGSLLALPYPYIVPGGRFSEQFYWDTYFIMLGLAADQQWGLIEGMMKNYTYMIRKYGYIPTGNRSYFLSRSQPPFFSHMVKLLARHKGRKVLVEYLPYMLAEYRFWMKGRNRLGPTEYKAFSRVVEMPNGILANRYYDNKTTPRPESLREDEETAHSAIDRRRDRLFLHLRAGAESGWDFSSRWFADPYDIRTIQTADIVPVDLNCLMYHLETTIAQAYRYLKQPLLARRYQHVAEKRAEVIREYCWDEESQFFVDYNFRKGSRSGALTLAALFPLYTKTANATQADAVAEKIEKEFLVEGGLLTTLIDNGQQWDSPNGWAPLHWVAIEGLRNYGHHHLADEIKRRWIATNIKVYETRAKLIEKYNVRDDSGVGGGGEYPLQDGFGWTNGVLAVLLDEKTSLED